MRKLLCVLCAAMLLCSVALAENIDLSGLSFQELVTLRDRCLGEMSTRYEWQEVTVPPGVWEVGVDIPAGHWSFRADPTVRGLLSAFIQYGDVLYDTGKEINGFASSFLFYHNFEEADPVYDLVLTTGYLVVFNAPVIVTPYTGKPDLGFK